MSTAFASSKNAINFFHIFFNQFFIIKVSFETLTRGFAPKTRVSNCTILWITIFFVKHSINSYIKLTERRQNI